MLRHVVGDNQMTHVYRVKSAEIETDLHIRGIREKGKGISKFSYAFSFISFDLFYKFFY